MDFGAIRALALETNLAVHGLPVTVIRPAPEDTPIETRGIWLTFVTEESPIGNEFTRRSPVRIMALSREAVPTIPRGTLIRAPEKLGAADVKGWIVDGLDRLEADHHRAIVLPLGEDEH